MCHMLREMYICSHGGAEKLPPCESLRQFEGKCDEVFDAEALRAEFEYRVCREFSKLLLSPSAAVCLCTDKRLERVTESLSALVESGLDNCLEEGLVAAE